MKDGTCVNNLDNWVKKSLSSKVLLPMTTILVWIWVKSSQSMQLACHCFLKLCDNNQLRAKNCCVNFASLLLQCSLFESGERITSSVTLFFQIGQTTYPFSIAHKNTGFYRKCFLQTNLNCLLRTFFLLSIRISSSFWNHFKVGLSINGKIMKTISVYITSGLFYYLNFLWTFDSSSCETSGKPLIKEGVMALW